MSSKRSQLHASCLQDKSSSNNLILPKDNYIKINKPHDQLSKDVSHNLLPKLYGFSLDTGMPQGFYMHTHWSKIQLIEEIKPTYSFCSLYNKQTSRTLYDTQCVTVIIVCMSCQYLLLVRQSECTDVASYDNKLMITDKRSYKTVFADFFEEIFVCYFP